MGDDDLLSLDFTAIAVPPAPEPIPAAPAPEPAALPLPVAVPDAPHLPRITLPAALIDAAELHAAGESLEASRRLETALKGGEKLGDAVRRVWLALFELLQELGRRPAFDTLALAYARRFEESPPTWTAAVNESTRVSETTAGRAQVALSGTLSAKAQTALTQIAKLAQTNSVVRLSLGKLSDADDEGCTLLLRALVAMKATGKECLLGAPDHLAALLASKIEMGRREHEPMWLLLLEMYQQALQQDAFEETAINYAVTFEMSPPSWTSSAVSAKTDEQTVAKDEPCPETFSLRGELRCATAADFAVLDTLAGEQQELDAHELTRIDSVSALALLTELRRWSDRGKTLCVTGLSQIVFAFLVSRDFDAIVELKTRKN